jgi:hypothetical protein
LFLGIGRAQALAPSTLEGHNHAVSTKVIEQQLADLQRRVSNLEETKNRRPRDAWRRIIGTSKGQILDQEAAKLGARWRSKENKRK